MTFNYVHFNYKRILSIQVNTIYDKILNGCLHYFSISLWPTNSGHQCLTSKYNLPSFIIILKHWNTLTVYNERNVYCLQLQFPSINRLFSLLHVFIIENIDIFIWMGFTANTSGYYLIEKCINNNILNSMDMRVWHQLVRRFPFGRPFEQFSFPAFVPFDLCYIFRFDSYCFCFICSCRRMKNYGFQWGCRVCCVLLHINFNIMKDAQQSSIVLQRNDWHFLYIKHSTVDCCFRGTLEFCSNTVKF